MLVYAKHISNRLQYILAFFSAEIFVDACRLTADEKEFIHYNGPKINYSRARLSANEFWLWNAELLFETGIQVQSIACFDIKGNKAFFKSAAGHFPFDIFAASFYLLSRYEEYLPHEKDVYGRYAHVNSLAFKENFLHLPLINIWLVELKTALAVIYPHLRFKDKQFVYLATYDIDIAWSYRNKGLWRNTGGFLRSVINKEWYSVKDRLQVVLNKKTDPFDSYHWLDRVNQYCPQKPVYFFLLAHKQMAFDKNISPDNKELQTLIRYHDAAYITGIHPSWWTRGNFFLLQEEIRQLAAIVGHRVTHSRQHYLRFTLPLTYQRLISAAIRQDYSMGYGTVNGFRASVASPFNWFDLEMDAATSLVINPFCFMDATAYYQLKLSPEQALEQLVTFHDCIKEIKGLMITIWHNNFLGTDPAFAGWRDAYELFLKETIARGGR